MMMIKAKDTATAPHLVTSPLRLPGVPTPITIGTQRSSPLPCPSPSPRPPAAAAPAQPASAAHVLRNSRLGRDFGTICDDFSGRFDADLRDELYEKMMTYFDESIRRRFSDVKQATDIKIRGKAFSHNVVNDELWLIVTDMVLTAPEEKAPSASSKRPRLAIQGPCRVTLTPAPSDPT